MTVYTTSSCPKCRILKQLMDSKGIKYEVVDDLDLIKQKEFSTVPVLEIEDETYTFSEAMKKIGGM